MIESLHSPHVARVKALIGSRGVKERRSSGLFVAEGIQCAREALVSTFGPKIQTLYLTQAGRNKLTEETFDEVTKLGEFEIVEVSEQVMQEMDSTISTQGALSVCEIPHRDLTDLKASGTSRFIYLHEVQDPGNAGTIIRTADAMGMDAVITSPGSVDLYSPKVVRSTAGSLWHLSVLEGVTFTKFEERFPEIEKFLLTAKAGKSITDLSITGDCVAIFGNEARGVSAEDLQTTAIEVAIPMSGRAESLNLASAASIVIFTLSLARSG